MMKTRNFLLSSVLTITVIGLFGAVLTTSLLPGSATAGGLLASHMHNMNSGHSRWGSGHCREPDAQTARLIRAYLGITLDLDEAQETQLEPVIGVLDRWHAEASAFCDHEAISNAPAALRQIDQLVTRTSEAMAELLPAFEAFYAALTPEQQERLNSWINQHHGSAT